ncbi:MAG: hypothetical protein EOM74_01080 [Methanomicrobia archaeon]|nr:hypothetical protein [Methanomicrobia archaeon]
MQRLGLGAMERVRQNARFPYKTGNLKFNATYLKFVGENEFRIVFDTTIAPYIPFLEYGTVRSKKHVNFISERATNDVIAYLAEQFKSPVVYAVETNGLMKYWRENK